jgi:hypothetical protein
MGGNCASYAFAIYFGLDPAGVFFVTFRLHHVLAGFFLFSLGPGLTLGLAFRTRILLSRSQIPL